MRNVFIRWFQRQSIMADFQSLCWKIVSGCLRSITIDQQVALHFHVSDIYALLIGCSKLKITAPTALFEIGVTAVQTTADRGEQGLRALKGSLDPISQPNFSQNPSPDY